MTKTKTKTKTATVWVAYMDTGGISYSGDEILAAAATEEGIPAALAARFDKALESNGDADRERWFAGNVDWDEDGTEHFGANVHPGDSFGSQLDLFGAILADYYGYTSEEVAIGGGAIA